MLRAILMTTTKSKYFQKRANTHTMPSATRIDDDPAYEPEYDTLDNDVAKVKKHARIEVKIEEQPLQVTSTKTRKRKVKKKPSKKVKKEPEDDFDDGIPSQPPANFWPMYNEIKKMRAKITTPVDSMGCAHISTRISGLTEGKVYRFQVLITLMLSSQTKDEVNYQAMKGMQEYFLSQGYEDGLCLQAILDVEQSKLDELIFKVGFHRRKALYIKKTAVIVNDKYDGEVPNQIDELLAFPGVGPKMGHLVLQICYNISDGISVDTHMARMAGWYHWVPNPKGGKPDPEYVRKCFEKMLSDHREEWARINPTLVGFGQVVCTPTNPRCDICTIAKTGLCPAVDKRLLRRVEVERERGIQPDQKKSRGDVSQLIQESENGS